jgi:hypothetical protein
MLAARLVDVQYDAAKKSKVSLMQAFKQTVDEFK